MVACRSPCDPQGLGRVQPTGSRSQHHGDLLRGGFQTIQGRVTSSTQRGAASRTSKRLDALGPAMLAIANERMHVSIGDPTVPALRVGTSETFGVYAFGGSSPAFELAPGTHRRWHWPYN
jgi:hypothetical protein